MSDPSAVEPVAPAAAGAATAPADDAAQGFSFTTDGCRSDVRLGALLVLAAVFLWLWLGPTGSSRLYLLGVPFLLWGVPMQALQARRQGRPGYPWKLGLTMTIGGALMWPDLTYQEMVGGPTMVQPVAPLLVAAGAWMLAWWPVAAGLGGRSTHAQDTVSAPVKGPA